MIKFKKIVVIIGLIISNLNFCQVNSELTKNKIIKLLNQSKLSYSSINGFSFKMESDVFESYSSNKVIEKTYGKYLKYGTNNCLKINDGEIIKVDKFLIKIDGSKKLMQINNFDLNQEEVYDMSKIYQNYNIFELSETQTEYICHLESSTISPTPYGKVKIFIDKKTMRLNKQIMYLYSAILIKGEKIIPRIEINFKEFSTIKVNPIELTLGYYVRMKDSIYIPSKNYINYKLVD